METWQIVLIWIAVFAVLVAFGAWLNWASARHAKERDAMTAEERAEHDNDRAW